ncbi:uncharacterized protein BYT42DRAFT_568965 [Radiomyces spectabilis]|uniref:uncharacterized protein n=1 Tax=Radiomyces spectabilis TaxID=64574 RepID=UPI00221FFEEA|nr:uncharacterized protein BYT42DRAFT_568965 [Radiomyces spectabilis]KAI8379490.1 hypothetical protein BYT42DRAFT_568965 [Radiomyces spectabilis]
MAGWVLFACLIQLLPSPMAGESCAMGKLVMQTPLVNLLLPLLLFIGPGKNSSEIGSLVMPNEPWMKTYNVY